MRSDINENYKEKIKQMCECMNTYTWYIYIQIFPDDLGTYPTFPLDPHGLTCRILGIYIQIFPGDLRR